MGTTLEFLAGGGEMGQRMRALDWSGTPLGPPSAWPQSLRSALSICLGAGFQIAIYWGPELSLLYNDAWSPILGRKHPEALGKPARQVWPEIWDTIGPLFDQVTTTGAATRSRDSLLAMHRHGFTEECYFDYTFSPIRDEKGEVGGIFNAVVETTFRVIGERRTRLLRDLSEQLAQVHSAEEACRLAAATLQGATLDLPFFLLYWRRSNLPSEPLTLQASSGLHPGTPGAPVQVHATDSSWPFATLEHSPALVSDLPGRLGDAAPRGPWPEACEKALVVPFNSGSGVFVAGISPRLAFDSEYREFLERIAALLSTAIARAQALEHERQRAEALAQIDRAKTTFFSNVSHEFRTPLTLMLGPLEDAINSAHLPALLQDPLRLAHRNALRLMKLVNHLLDFSRIEAGRTQARFEPTDLARLTLDLASTFRSAMQKAGLEFSIQCDESSTPAYVDRDMWEKIVLNLLSNAFKFTLSGAVSVKLSETARHAVLEIQDTGVGIPADELPRIFDRFHRVANTQARTHEGSGIGLALVHELVKLHGGDIRVESELGHGTTFRVEIPLGSDHLAQDRLALAASAASTATPSDAYVEEALRWLPQDASGTSVRLTTPNENISLLGTEPRVLATSGARVLLADDNADMSEYVRRLLDPHYEVITVGDGQAALDAVRNQKPDIVITDVMMPRMDGFQLLKKLRDDPDTAQIPVILLSARAGEESVIEGLAAGADDYLVKPFSARELVARVGATLALARVRREAAAKLHESEERFRAVQEASPDGFTLLEPVCDEQDNIVDFRWVYLNEAAARTAGHPREQLLGRRVLDIHPGNAPAGLIARYANVLRTGKPWIGELHYQHDNLDALVRLGVAKVGNQVGVTTVDISERYKAEEALKMADRQKDEFLAMLAHELRNPLAPIRTASELLGRLSREPQAQSVVEIVRRQVAHLSRLVDDLLDVSRITQGRIVLQRQTVDVADLIRQAIETVEPTFRERRHNVKVHSSYPTIHVNGDVARLVQTLVNLLTNAAKYTDAGGEILLTARAQGQEAVIEVSDNGAGIPAALLPKIFDLFVQSDRTLDRAEGGLGIGLSVVRRLVEMHGGSVSARSDGPGRGSTFTVRLPRVAPSSPLPDAAKAASLSAKRILVIDDNVDAANTLAMMLRLEGHDTHVAYDGTRALEQLETFRPDVILLDIGLPGMDGYQVAQRIRASGVGASAKIIALTGYGQPEDRDRTESAGFDDHLVKPVSLEAISAALAVEA